MRKHLRFYLLALISVFFVGCAAPQPVESAVMEEEENAPAVSTAQPDEEGTMTASESAENGNADVVHVRAVKDNEENTWTFSVTVQHPDQGWDDYADGWDVVTPDGVVLKADPEEPFTRLLLHPHVEEQPFTRSQSSISIPSNVTEVRVRAHDLVDGYGGKEILVDLTRNSGPGYEVER
ncbi:MAG: hypothetical protein R6U51_11105 [Anaerolineales bacterium]